MAAVRAAVIDAGIQNKMYAEFFRLNRGLFRATPKGSEVFVGPQTARIVKSIKSALVGHDAIVAVTGEAGVGKSTLVNRALDAFAGSMELLRMPRAQLRHDEVLDFLLAQLAVTDPPAGTIRRVLACRDALAARARAGHGVCIVVEDADRIGEDALLEIEALTSAGAGDDPGARVVLLGGNTLRDILQKPPLARLSQRTRLRFTVQPFGAGELLAYLKHGFRLAGGDFERVFADDVVALVHAASGGVARQANNLVEALLETAAEQKTQRIDGRFVSRVARELGLDCGLPPATAADSNSAVPSRPAAPPAAPAADSSGRPVAARPQTRNPAAPAAAGKRPAGAGTPPPAAAPLASRPAAGPAAPVKMAAEPASPGLIQDTLPDLEQLAPELARVGTAARDATGIPTLFSSARIESPVPEPAPSVLTEATAGSEREFVTESQPDAVTEPAPALPSAPPSSHAPGPLPGAPPAGSNGAAVAGQTDDVPAWDKDPTLAELRPDIEALELAMMEFAQDEPQAKTTEDAADVPDVVLRDPTLAGLPAITLDVAIQQKIAEATEALKKHDQTIAEEEVADAPTSAKAQPPPRAPNPGAGTPAANDAVPARRPNGASAATRPAGNTDLQRVAAGLARARSLEDVDDRMAETLFGEEFSSIAAEVAANAPSVDGDDPAPSIELQLEAGPIRPDTAADTVESEMEREFREVYGAEALEVSLQGDLPRGGLDLSASQRLATVRALNAERKLSESAVMRTGRTNGGSPQPRIVPSQTIEEQISVSMTQTLKALNSRPANDDDDDDDGERKGGFFSRFRKH